MVSCLDPVRGKGKVSKQDVGEKGGNPYIHSFSIHIPTDLWLEPGAPRSFIALCKRTFAVFEVPRCTRAAMSFIERVVSRRSRTAIPILSGSFFRRSINSLSLQPKRSNSSATIRPPLASAVSRRNSPAWCWPSLPSIRANCSWRNASLPTYQPRRNASSLSSSTDSCRRRPSVPQNVVCRRSIFRDSMFTQKPVRSHPLRPMFRG